MVQSFTDAMSPSVASPSVANIGVSDTSAAGSNAAGSNAAGTGAAERSCAVVRRYITEALFGGDERVLKQTVSDHHLRERAWLFWAAFVDRHLEELDVLFANADGSRVACHFTASMVQTGSWMTSTSSPGDRLTMIECAGTYVLTDGMISSYLETWR